MKSYEVELATIKKVVVRQTMRGYKLEGFDVEDLVQEIFAHFLEKDFFAKFDPDGAGHTKSYRYFVWVAAYRQLITLSRKQKFQTLSLDRRITSQAGFVTFKDLLRDESIDLEVDYERQEFFEDVVRRLPTRSFSSTYSLSPRELFVAKYLERRPVKEIASSIKTGKASLSAGRVSQLLKDLRRIIRTIVVEQYPELIPA